MNKIAVGIIAAVAAFTAVANDPPGPPSAAKPKLSREEIAARRAKAIKLANEKAGGFVTQAVTGNVIRVSNTSAKVQNWMLDKILEEMRSNLDVPVVISTDKSVKTAFLLEVKDAGDAPAILIAPENAWAQVNVSALEKGNPDQKTLNGRVIKECWRALGLALGAGYSTYQPDLMDLITDSTQLDAIQPLSPCPASYNMMMTTAQRIGVQRVRRATYRAACKQGWAPAPTNDLQRAIWEEVHELPTNPIKIKFDPKKDR